MECESLGLTDDVWDMITNCWTMDPNQRPTAKGVVDCLSPKVDGRRRVPSLDNEEVGFDSERWRRFLGVLPGLA